MSTLRTVKYRYGRGGEPIRKLGLDLDNSKPGEDKRLRGKDWGGGHRQANVSEKTRDEKASMSGGSE